jgi:predicted Zn-dependent protease
LSWLAHLRRRIRALERDRLNLEADSCRRDADTVLERMKQHLTPDELPLALALAAETLARFDEAESLFEEARRLRPHNAIVLLRSAEFYLRLNRPAEAEPLLRAVFGKKVRIAQERLDWPRRQLALALAETGDEGRDEALRLLDLNVDHGADPTADARVRAFVRGAQASERLSAIRDIEATVTPLRPLRPDEQFRLARLYDAEGDWEAARQRLQALVDHDGDPDNPEYLMYLVRGLLRHDQRDEARPYVQRLKSFAGGYARCRAVVAEGEK